MPGYRLKVVPVTLSKTNKKSKDKTQYNNNNKALKTSRKMRLIEVMNRQHNTVRTIYVYIRFVVMDVIIIIIIIT